MNLNAASFSDGAEVQADICILGAGAAGIAMAKTFIGTKLNVVLVESGNFQTGESTQSLNRGVARFPQGALQNDYLLQSRQRGFGGSTKTWAGHCHPLSDSDFQSRDWVPHSGWPIQASDLQPFYEQAAQLVEIKAFPDANSEREQSPQLGSGSTSDFSSVVFQRSPPTRFGEKYKKDIINASNIQLLLDCNVNELLMSANGKEVFGVELLQLNKKKLKVKAKKYVLALGGIENARILLSSQSQNSKGVGNSHDVVGRYFMEHLFGLAGFAVIDSSTSFFKSSHQILKALKNPKAQLALTPEVQKKNQILSGCFYFEKENEPGLFSKRGIETPMASAIDDLTLGFSVARAPKRASFERRKVVYLFEQAPHPESRVVLSSERNQLGQQQAELTWKLTSLERKSLSVATKILGQAMGASGAGRLRVDESNWYLEEGWAAHHMGTTRMHSDPKKGVVDSHCRVHDVQNLFIAGSSVFTTGGMANPTFTILALALRLSEHLRKV